MPRRLRRFVQDPSDSEDGLDAMRVDDDDDDDDDIRPPIELEPDLVADNPQGLGTDAFEREIDPDINHGLWALPEAWRDGEGIDQDVITQRIRRSVPSNSQDATDYQKMSKGKLYLSKLRSLFEQNDEQGALSVLKRKYEVVIDDRFIVDPMSPHYDWALVGMYIDYRLAIGNSLGLYAALPNTSTPAGRVNPDWTFTFVSNKRHWRFRGDLTALGDDDVEFVFIGYTSANEEVFLALTRDHAISTPLPSEPIPPSKRSTCMDPRTARVMFVMLAYMLQSSRIGAIYLRSSHLYPGFDSDRDITPYSNIFEQNLRHFSLQEMIALNETIVEKWDEWYRGAPPEYKLLPGMKDTVPCALVIRYGQNRQLHDGDSTDDARLMSWWANAADYKKLARVDYAFAGHVRCSKVDLWVPIPPDKIEADHDEIYKTPYADPNELIDDLSQYRLTDEDDEEEIPIYDKHGNRIPRREAHFFGEPRHCGLLQDLRNIHTLFPRSRDFNFDGAIVPDEFDDDDDDLIDVAQVDALLEPEVRVSSYTHGFLPQYGQWQADGVIPKMEKLAQQITRETRRMPGGGPIVEPLSSQCYNTFAHQTRESARLHIAQTGQLTGTVSGAWATSRKGNETFCTFFQRARGSLPHRRLEQQVLNVEKPCLRFENVFRIHLDRMDPELLEGETFYEEVIDPILKMYEDPEVFQSIRERCLVLRHDIYPKLYLWTSYPIVTLIEKFWTHHASGPLARRYAHLQEVGVGANTLPFTQRLAQVPDHYVVEMIAVLERLLNFCHTGLAKVLSHSLMTQMFPARAILDGCYPFFWDGLRFRGTYKTIPVIDLARWPLNERSKMPLMASARSQQLTYGWDHQRIYESHFKVRVMLSSKATYGSGQNTPIVVMSRLVMDAYIADVIALVGVAVDEVKQTLAENPSHRHKAWMKTRIRAYKIWKAVQNPLSFGAEPDFPTLELLTQAISATEHDSAKSLPESPVNTCSVRDFVDRLYAVGISTTNNSVVAPVTKDGSACHMLRIVIAELLTRLRDAPNAADTIKVHLGLAAVEKDIHFFPDRIGDTTRHPSPQSWTRITKGSHGAYGRGGRALTLAAQITRDFQKVAHAQLLEDPNAEWTVTGMRFYQFCDYVSHDRLPSDWSFAKDKYILADPFTRSVYEWAKSRFESDLQDWQCRLAFVLAFVHSLVLPRVCAPHGGKDATAEPFLPRLERLNESVGASSIALMRQVPFIAKDKKKGFSNQGIFFTVASTVYLAWIDPTSPIRKHLRTNESLPQKWVSKHSTKGVSIPNMIRFGIMEGWGRAILFSPKYRVNFRVRSEQELQLWEQRINGLLKQGSQGAYVFASAVLGDAETARLMDAGHFNGPHKRKSTTVAPAARPSSSNRRTH